MPTNTKPSTPFGKLFDKLGIWHPTFGKGIANIFDKLRDVEQNAIKEASGWIAIINANLDKAPDVVFDLLKQKFPNITKENITEKLAQLSDELKIVGDKTPATFEDAVGLLQGFLIKYEGKAWVNATKFAVTALADILTGKKTPIESISAVLDFVYWNFIKDKVV